VTSPGPWYNPIVAAPGQVQAGVDPGLLLPSRSDLSASRLAIQRQLLQSGQRRRTPIQVTSEGVTWDGHHGARAAAEAGQLVDVLVVQHQQPPSGLTLMQLPVG
jgi:hypothetical protein